MTQCMLQMSSFKNHSPVVDVWFVLYLAFGVQGWSMNWECPWARCLPHSICLRVCELGNPWKSAVWRGQYQVSHQSEAIYTIAHSPAKVSEDISLIIVDYLRPLDCWEQARSQGLSQELHAEPRSYELNVPTTWYLLLLVYSIKFTLKAH